jgi:hypothetical protein
MNLLKRIEKLEARLADNASRQDAAAVWLYEGPEEARTYWRAGSSRRLSEEQMEAELGNARVCILLPDNGRDSRLRPS